MIKIEVEDYCHECLDFQPDVEKPVVLYSDTDRYVCIGDTIVRCEYRQRCKAIENHVKNKYDGRGGYGGACYIGKCGETANIDKKE